MYTDNDLSISTRRANMTRSFVESAIKSYEESNSIKETSKNNYNNGAMVFESVMHKEGIRNRYHSFVESVKSSLVIDCLYNIFENAIERSKRDYVNTSIMRAMVSQYVFENGYDNILDKMKTASVSLSEMYNIINSTSNKIIESVDKDNPNTFCITPNMKDEFYKSLDYSDSQSISDAIKDRVVNAMDDFITANTKDHEDIESALNQAQEKIESSKDNEELKESYEIQAKRKTTNIRNNSKNVFHCMVTSMCENVLKHQEENSEFMKEGHLDINKIVTRTSLMYTFMEMLNTSRLEKIDESFIKNTIESLKK